MRRMHEITLFVGEDGTVHNVTIKNDQEDYVCDIPGWEIEQEEMENTTVSEFVKNGIKYYDHEKENC